VGVLAAADRAKIEKLLSVARATRPLPAEDGSLFFASNRAGHMQIYRQGGPGEEPVLVVASQTRMVPHAHTPSGLLIREDIGGNEVWQLGIVDGGEHRRLTADANAIHHSVTLHPDRRRVGLGWNPGGQADIVLGELDLRNGAKTPWVAPGGFWRWGAWSPDGERAAVMKMAGTPTEGYILERDGRMTRLLSSALRVQAVAWLDVGILVMTDLGRDFLGVAVVEPERPDVVERWLFDEQHEVAGVTLDPPARKAAVVVNSGIYDSVRILEVATGQEVDRLGLAKGVTISDHTGDPDYHVGWSHDSARLFISWELPTRPAEIYEWPGGTRWTFTADVPHGLVEPEELSYKSFDGLDVPSLFYRAGGEPRPAVVYFHGGPEGQSRGRFEAVAHLFNGIGVSVLLPNVRGSAGYGIRFQSLDDKALRRNSVKDGCEAARYLKKSGLASRAAAMGGSYGGFMTLAVLVEDPDLWDAGVDVVGIADWHTFFRNMPPWRGVLRINEYGDPNGAEADFLREISPIHKASSIKAPLLVIHGRNDPRVPVGESIQITQAVGRSELLIFEDEGHGVIKLANQVTANSKILEFMAEHLL